MNEAHGDSDDDDAAALQLAPPRVYRTVFDHLKLLSPAAADRLFGKVGGRLKRTAKRISNLLK
jgi:hypothetical protein